MDNWEVAEYTPLGLKISFGASISNHSYLDTREYRALAVQQSALLSLRVLTAVPLGLRTVEREAEWSDDSCDGLAAAKWEGTRQEGQILAKSGRHARKLPSGGREVSTCHSKKMVYTVVTQSCYRHGPDLSTLLHEFVP